MWGRVDDGVGLEVPMIDIEDYPAPTVDGSEIVEVGSLFHYLQGFINPRWLAGVLPSTVSLTVRHLKIMRFQGAHPTQNQPPIMPD